MMIDQWALARQIQEDTGLTPDQILALPADEYARLSGRPTFAQSAAQALDHDVPGTPRQEPAPVPQNAPGAPQSAPQGIDLADMTMALYAAVRGQLGVQGREYGRGALDGGSTADWIAAAQRKAGRSAWQGGNVQDAARIDADKYLTKNEPVTGRTGYYR